MTNKNARYEGDWYYCWLVERRDAHRPTWLGEYSWVTDANEAIWFARESDAKELCRHQHLPHAVVCEHGFMLAVPSSAEPCTCGIGMSSLRRHDKSCPRASTE